MAEGLWTAAALRYRAQMRWDRLFADLEAQSDEIDRDERDALADELLDGEWAGTSWRELLGGPVVLEVLGGGRIEGEVSLVNERVVQLRGERADHVVATDSVVAVHSSGRRAEQPGAAESRLGWGHVFRALRDSGEEVVARLTDGSTREGVVAVVGRDFVRLRAPSGRTQDVVWSALAVVSGRT